MHGSMACGCPAGICLDDKRLYEMQRSSMGADVGGPLGFAEVLVAVVDCEFGDTEKGRGSKRCQIGNSLVTGLSRI